jgi:7-keto-8-aminopelargonate synthetase-like enzyme
LATVLAGFDVNDSRGDDIRASLYRNTAKVLKTTSELGLATPNTSGLPIIEVPLQNADDIDEVGRFLDKEGIYVTLAAYPLVPRGDVYGHVSTEGPRSAVDRLSAATGW